MNLIPRTIRHYFLSTRTLLYSYLISLPLLICYELLIVLTQPDPSSVTRIGIDVWIKTLFSQVGYNTLSITLLLAALLGLLLLVRHRRRFSSIRSSYFLGMLLEAFIYAITLALLIGGLLGSVLHLITPSATENIPVLHQLALAIGAGLYEELFFRVFLIFLLYHGARFIFDSKTASYTAAILTGAVIFSLAHFTGAYGDPFSLSAFFYRFLFGIALNVIYVLRGFGMAAWTHASYDLMVVAFL